MQIVNSADSQTSPEVPLTISHLHNVYEEGHLTTHNVLLSARILYITHSWLVIDSTGGIDSLSKEHFMKA